MKQRFELYLSFLILVSFCFIGTPTSWASECYVPTVCQAFSRAEVVFTGELLSVERGKKLGTSDYLVTFKVDEVFKGTAGQIESASLPSSFDTELKIGQSYFVYKDKTTYFPPVCNRTSLLREAVSELKYAKALSSVNPTFEISGLLSGESKDDLIAARVCVSTPSGVQQLTVDQQGYYRFSAKGRGEYKVIVQLPFLATIFINNFGSLFATNGREADYTVSFKPNECDFRNIQFAKQD